MRGQKCDRSDVIKLLLEYTITHVDIPLYVIYMTMNCCLKKRIIITRLSKAEGVVIKNIGQCNTSTGENRDTITSQKILLSPAST